MKRGLAYYLTGVNLLGLLASGLTFGRALLIAAFGRKASKAVHDELCDRVLVQASTRHFDRNPSGRLLQNFAKDLEQIDSGLPGSLRSAVSCICTLVGTMAIIVLATPSFLVVLVPLSWVYSRSLQYYRPVARELKRLEPLARSPVYAVQAMTASGVTTIRKLGLERSMAKQALDAIDSNTAVSFAAKAVDRWFSLRMELVGNTIVLAAALLGLLGGAGSSSWAAAKSAIAVTQALSVVGLLNWTVRTVAQTETAFTSFQRVVDVLDATEVEAPKMLPSDSEIPSVWPSNGRVVFHNVSLRYSSDLPLVLQGVDLELRPGERVGVIGRTGSGKSTLLRALLRTVEVSEGTVEVDGLDIRSLGLARLRSAVTAIPQDNFLVTGSVRQNVDPRGEHTDDEVRRALESASLGKWLLERHMQASGGDVSPGEKQLLGVARAILRGSKVVALDEVTSRVDEATDRQVQLALQRLPTGTTLLVVSHRIKTLQDYDTVVVMEAGRVVEMGDPRDLSSDPKSRFAAMLAAEQTGELLDA